MTRAEWAAEIEKWPWTKTLVGVGVLGFAITHAVGMLTTFLVVVIPPLRVVGAEHLALFKEAREWFNDGLQWSIVAATGGVVGLGLKRAATKPEVVAAEGEAAAKMVAATAAAVPPLTGKQAVEAARSVTADQETTERAPAEVFGDEVAEPVAAAPLSKPTPGGGES